MICQKINCGKIAQFTCRKGCPIQYCSDICMDNDRDIHQIVCYADHGERVRAYYNRLTQNSKKAFNPYTLSYRYRVDNVLGQISIFNYTAETGYYCVMCGSNITIDHDILLSTNSRIMYRLCVECKNNNRFLCSETFTDMTLCISRKKHSYYSIWCLSQVILADVALYIGSIMNMFNCNQNHH